MREEFGGTTDSVFVCSGCVEFVTSAMFHSGTNMPSFDAMGCPTAAIVRWFMDEGAGSWWCQWCSVEVKGSKELCVSGELGIDSGGTEEIECKLGLWQESAP